MSDKLQSVLQSLPVGRWTLDPRGSVITIATKNFLGRPINGRFSSFNGLIEIVAPPALSHVHIAVSAKSIATGSKMRDRDLQKTKIFHSEKWAEICFESSDVKLESGVAVLNGRLTVRNVTKPLVVRATCASVLGADRYRFTGAVTVSPRDFGILHPFIRKPVAVSLVAEIAPLQIER